jgi:hypothetical protein
VTVLSDGKRRFLLRVENDGNAIRSFRVTGGATGRGWRVTYLAGQAGTADITDAVTGNTYLVADLDPAEVAFFRLVIKRGPDTPTGATRAVVVRVRALGASVAKDAVRIVVTGS